jgi:hypothetical protein
MPHIFSPNENPYNQSRREELLRQYSRAVCGLPRNQNPVMDPDGSLANSINQGPMPGVYFCAHFRGNTPPNRSITVKVGTDLVLPIMVIIATQPELPSGSTFQDCIDADQNSIGSIQLEVPGTQVQNLDDYRVTTNQFSITQPSDNINDGPSGNHQTMAKGIIVVVRCDQVGLFNLSWSGNLTCNGPHCIEQSYSENIRYTINVVP